jgi:hypothetical protein
VRFADIDECFVREAFDSGVEVDAMDIFVELGELLRNG